MRILAGLRNGLIFSIVIWAILLLFLSIARADEFTITVDKDDLPYLQSKADEEKITIQQLLEKVAKGVANGQISKKYMSEVIQKKTITEMKNELKGK